LVDITSKYKSRDTLWKDISSACFHNKKITDPIVLVNMVGHWINRKKARTNDVGGKAN
jgi:hypothetical protein